MRKILLLLLFIAAASLVFSQDEDDFFSEDVDLEDMDFDNLFSEEAEDDVEVVEDKSDEIAESSSEFLTTEGVEWGGSFNTSLAAGVSYEDFVSLDKIADHKSYDETFTPTLDAELHFNARPKEDLRFYGKFKTSIPFYKKADVLVPGDDYNNFAPDLSKTSSVSVGIPDITIYELFNDFNYKNKAYFRVGKQNATWGVGYFFSPADFLSLGSIDPENPEADREGPIAVKVSMPFELNNLYLYVTVPNSVLEDPEEASVSDLIVAPMFQMLVGDTEISTGFYFQKDSAKRVMVSATYGTSTLFGKFSFFGEAVGMYGSDKKFFKSDYTVVEKKEDFFFSGTVGFRWEKKIAENNFSFAGQYLFNGEGYDKDDADPVKDIVNMYKNIDNLSDIEKASLFSKVGDTKSSDYSNRHKHYAGASFGITNLFDNEDLSISALTMMNLVDVSGFVKPSVSYSFFDELSLSLSSTINLSDKGDEYYNDRFAFELKVTLGGGSF